MDPPPQMVGSEGASGASDRIVYVVDDESEVRRSLGFFLKTLHFMPRPFLSGSDLLADAAELPAGCVLLDIRMPELDGMQVIERLSGLRADLPIIAMTGHGDIATAVRAMKLGAIDFLEKPFQNDVLVAALGVGFETLERNTGAEQQRRDAERRMAALTQREREVLNLLGDGKSNKEVAIALDLSVRTVEMHRATMFERLGVRTLPEALRLAFRARTDLAQPA